MDLTVRPLEAERTHDLFALFDAAEVQGATYRSGCYCAYPFFEGNADQWAARTPAENRAAMEEHSASGRSYGYLAYADGQPVGWCLAAPKAALRLASGPSFWRNIDQQRTGSIACFLVLPEIRRQGVAKELLAAACEGLKAQGFEYAEAYGVERPGSDPQVYRGWAQMYFEAGFTEVSSVGNRRLDRSTLVLRKWLTPTPEWENSPLLPLRLKARWEVKDAYETLAVMASTPPHTLAAINRSRPAHRQRTLAMLANDYWQQARAMSNFACNLGLISGEEDGDISREFYEAYPDLLPDDS